MSNDLRRDVSSPRIARVMLRWMCVRQNREFIIGDLEEQFQDQVDSIGLRNARKWYWSQVWRCFSRTSSTQATQKNEESHMGFLDSLRVNFRFAIRSLRKSPGFAVAAILTLALGIGPNTAIFSIVDAILLRPLHFREGNRLVSIWETDKSDSNQPWRVTPANFHDYKDQATVFEDMTAFGAFAATLTGRGDPVQLKGSAVAANYFSVLGMQPFLGRAFTAADEKAGVPLIVLGYDFWRTRLAGQRSIIGENLILDGTSCEVIGVMPPGIYPSWPVNGPVIHFSSEYQDVWTLVSPRFNSRRSHVWGVIARMKKGITVEQAQEQMSTIAARLEKQYSDDKDEGALVRPLMDEITGTVRPALLILLVAVGSVLLIACTNVAGLSLARLTSRRHEIAVREALGAGRVTIASQFIAEGLILALLAGAIGIFFAFECHHLLIRLIPQEIPRLENVQINGRVLMFTVGISFLASLIFALAPALTVFRWNISAALQETSRGNESLPSQRLRQFLVATQVSLAVVLTLSAGLLAQSFWRLQQINPGFRTENLLIAELVLPDSKYDTWQKIDRFYQDLLEKIRHLPDVRSADIAYDHPLEENWLTGFSLRKDASGKSQVVQLRLVSPGYFSNIGPAIVEGREFTMTDDSNHPGVAVINESFRRRFFGAQQPLGKMIFCTAASTNWKGEMPDRFQVVGVAGDVEPPGIDSKTEPFLYISSRQFPRWEMKVLVRTVSDPANVTASIRNSVFALDNNLPVGKMIPMSYVLSQTVSQPRFNMVLMLLFSGLALILALVGIYGLIALWVASRGREIGMRLALGAKPSSVVLLVLENGAKLVITGVLFGTLATFAVSRFLQSQLFGISVLDPLTYFVVPIGVLLAGVLACIIPAKSAVRVDPMVALRSE